MIQISPRQSPDRVLLPLLALGAGLTFILSATSAIVGYGPEMLGCAGRPGCLAFGEWSGLMPWGLPGVQQLLAALTWPLIALTTLYVWLRYRGLPWIAWPLALTTPLIVGRVWLALDGGRLQGAVPDTIQFGLILALQGLVTVSAASAFRGQGRTSGGTVLFLRSRFGRLALVTTAAMFGVLLSGSIARIHAPAACPSWPFCGQLPAGLDEGAWIHLVHRGLVGLAAVLMFALTWSAWRRHRAHTSILAATSVAATLFVAQAYIGAAQQLDPARPWLGSLHSLASACVWAALVAMLVSTGLARSPDGSLNAGAAHAQAGRRRAWDFVILTKPIILLLLLFTTLSGMVVAAGGPPPLPVIFWTMLGGGLAAAGSSAVNQYIDRRRDRMMVRTAGRPIAARRITPAEGLAFGLALSLTSFFLLAVQVNLVAAVLAVVGILYYVVLYSLLLKHATVQNIVIGGGAGAIPPLVGYAAVTGGLTWPSLMLFVIIFFWTPPHFWALALVRRKDYQRAGVPMLPVVRGEAETRRQILIYTLSLVALTLTLPVVGLGGLFYLISAGLLGLWLIHSAWQVWRSVGNKVAWKMYRYSSMYLAFLFLALMVDAAI